MANEADLKLIEIPQFPKTDTLVGSGPEYVVLTKADGVTYGMLTEDFKAFLGTVQVQVPKPLASTDPVPTLAGVYLPADDGTFPDGIIVDRSESGADYGMSVQLIFDGTDWFKVSEPLPLAENKIPDWIAGTYTTGKQVNHNGQIWAVKNGVISTAQEPGVGSDWEKKLNVPQTDNIVGKNLFNRDDIRKNLAISVDGLIFATSNFWISTFIPATELTDYIWSATNIPNSIGLGFYSAPNDLETSIVGGMQIPGTVTKRVLPFTTPAGTKYIAFTVKHSTWAAIPADMMLRLATEDATYAPYESFTNIADMSISQLYNAKSFGEITDPKSVVTKEYLEAHSGRQTSSVDTIEIGDLGNVSIQVPSSEINILTSYGQSNSAGQQSAPALSVNNFRGNLMLGSQEWGAYYGNTTMNVLNPLYARPAIYTGLTQAESEAVEITNQALCESQNINYANANKNMLDKKSFGSNRVFLALNAGVGGRSIELLSKGAPNTQATFYALLMGHLTSAKNAAIAAGKTISCNSFTWIQGEYNATQQAGQGWETGTPATNNKEQYKGYLKQLITDIFTDVKALFAQNDNPAFFMTQHATGWINSFAMPIQMALLETSNEDSRAIMVCPLYPVTDRGHLDPNGQRWIGEYISKAYNQVVLNGKPWSPLQPTKLSRSGKRLVIDYFVPVAPLRFDIHTVRQMVNYGFTIKVNGAVSPIEKVEITSASQITITAFSDIDTGALEVGYASFETLYGNVCDSDNYRSFEVYKELPTQLKPVYEPKDENGVVIYNKPYPLQNFSLQFYYKMESGDSVKVVSHVLD